ncbi:hypothetical protein BD410DRAFT_802153 [Rickenella mellea]|uniref:Uncharacterized protein n=1 Tax=Rickenella mellea TaxID=50990 RepID=A0A4Y7Q9J2_9AGAM|nr:hypothetical protein BD410DRAFT_802153 [Rickenella mellea]
MYEHRGRHFWPLQSVLNTDTCRSTNASIFGRFLATLFKPLVAAAQNIGIGAPTYHFGEDSEAIGAKKFFEVVMNITKVNLCFGDLAVGAKNFFENYNNCGGHHRTGRRSGGTAETDFVMTNRHGTAKNTNMPSFEVTIMSADICTTALLLRWRHCRRLAHISPLRRFGAVIRRWSLQLQTFFVAPMDSEPLKNLLILFNGSESIGATKNFEVVMTTAESPHQSSEAAKYEPTSDNAAIGAAEQ